MQKINNFLHRLLYPYLRTPPLVSWFKKKGEQRYKQAEEKRKKLEAERKELIRIIAYHLWEDEGKQNNKDKYYWFKAVEEIKLINKLLKPVRKFTSKLRESLDKPLWEWLVEVIIPYLAIITAAGAVIYETNENRKNFKEEIKAIRTQIVKQDLIEYKRQILDLILNKKLLEAKDNNPEAVRAAKSLTSSTIKALDSEQNQDLTDFLYNMRLTQKDTLELLTENNFTKANLSGANLSGANLSRADLSGADLSGADLRGANLSGAYPIGADLSGANLSHADLSNADPIGANLSGANLSRANLSSADLRSANLSGANLLFADLIGTDLSGADLRSTDLIGADLRNAKLYGANLSGAYLYSANLYGAGLSRANLRGADLSGAYLSHAYLEGANLNKISWNEQTNWKEVKKLKTAHNIPEELKQQLGL